MKLIKVASAVLNQTPRDWKGNKQNIIDAILMAKEQNVSVLCLPEMCITGYGMEDDYFCSDVPRRAALKLLDIINYTPPSFDAKFPRSCNEYLGRDIVFCVGLPIQYNNTLYNAIATIANGTILGFTCKQHLAGDGIHYENRWFKPWPKGVVKNINIPELGEYPIGDIHFDIGGIKIGYEICEDAWVANRPGAVLAGKGVDIIMNPSASHFSFNKLNTRKNFVVDGSRAFNVTYIYSNLVGNEAGRAIYDGSSLIATGGELVAIGKRFTFKNFLLTTAVVDIENTRTAQVRSTSFEPCVTNVKNYDCIKCNDFTYWEISEKLTTNPSQELWENSPDIKHEECTRALGLALMDYMRKSHTKGFTIALSGGADSAMVAYQCAMGIRMAINELGIGNFIKKYCPHLINSLNFQNLDKMDLTWVIKNLITTAYEATAQSGNITKNAASAIAYNLYTKHYEFDVQPVLNEYLKLGCKVKNRDLNFDDDDIVLQNLQARTRAPLIWMLANMETKLLLTTSNMSEAAVGYATMDGDTAGCVAPIAGLSKVYIREYLKWVEKWFPTMKLINEQQPTAELRPASSYQTDETDLMPYWLLHKIETMVVKNRYTPVEIYEALITSIDYDQNQLIKDITKFFKLFSQNQWKRERTAISFHMDDHNLDPKTWCRVPLLSGSYEEELEELKQYIKC